MVLVYASTTGKALPVELDDNFDIEALVPQYHSELMDAAGDLLELKFVQSPEQMEMVYNLIRDADPTFNLVAYTKHNSE